MAAGLALIVRWTKPRSHRLGEGRRVTDEATLKIVERTLAGEVNKDLADEIERLGGRAVNLNFANGTNVLYARNCCWPR